MRVLLVIAAILYFFVGRSQPIPEINLEDFSEHRFELQDTDLDYGALYESLLLYYTNPIDINTATREELAALHLLSPTQLNGFMDYRNRFGKLFSLYELQAIPELDDLTINEMRPFITLDPINDSRPIIKRILTEENNYLLLRFSTALEKQKGFQRNDGSGYTGDPYNLYGRFRVSHPGDFSMGFTFEKDAGESWSIDTNKKQYGFDYYSGHLLIENQGPFKTIAVGDFQMQFGQGLVYGSGFGFGKGAETVNTVMRNTLGVRPYTSTLESGFFRGAATTLNMGNAKSSFFVSYNQLDAHLVSDSSYSNFDEFVNSIQATGYHRTSRELASKNQLQEWSGGLGVTFALNRNFNVGLTGFYSAYSSPIQKKPNNYNQYEFSGRQNAVASVFTDYSWRNFLFFGEGAVSLSGGMGMIAGLIASLSPEFDFSWVIRHYEKDFHSFYSNSFSENSRTINEKGMYWGFKYRPHEKFELAFYYDRFRFPWLKYRVESPSQGFEYLARATYHINRSVSIYAQYRAEQKERTIPQINSNLNSLIPTVKRNYLLNLDYQINRYVGVKTRVQGSYYTEMNHTSKGFAIVQDLNISIKRFKISTRFATFDSDNFANRQYVYERDVLYAFSLPAYQGAGTRSYLLLQFNVLKQLRFYGRYARFYFTSPERTGSGLSEIPGNIKSEVKLMVRMKI